MTERMDAILDLLADAAMAVLADGQILSANNAALRLSGYESLEELTAKKVRSLLPEFRQAWLGDSPEPMLEAELKHRAGGRIPIHLWASRMTCDNSAAAILLFRERAQTAQHDAAGLPVLHSDAQLLASRVGHELANLLTPLLGYLELAKMDENDLASLNPQLTVFEGISRRIHIHVQNLLRVRRRGPGVRRNASLTDAIAGAVNFFKESQIGKTHVLEQLNLESIADVQFENEGELLQHLLINLLFNASESMSQPGKITISASACDDTTVALEIADLGQGIPQEIAPRIYDPFFTTKSQGGAAGLGLYAGRSIVERLGVAISHRRNSPNGTVFTLMIRKSARSK